MSSRANFGSTSEVSLQPGQRTERSDFSLPGLGGFLQHFKVLSR